MRARLTPYGVPLGASSPSASDGAPRDRCAGPPPRGLGPAGSRGHTRGSGTTSPLGTGGCGGSRARRV